MFVISQQLLPSSGRRAQTEIQRRELPHLLSHSNSVAGQGIIGLEFPAHCLGYWTVSSMSVQPGLDGEPPRILSPRPGNCS